MTPTQVAEIKAQLASLQARLSKLEATEKGRETELLPGFSFIIGDELKGKAYRGGEINACIKEVCERVREANSPIILTTWHVPATSNYNSHGVLVSVQCEAPVKVVSRVISVKEAAAYFEGERNALLRKVNYDSTAYKVKRVNIRLTKDGEVKKYMRVRAR
jgi:hypothetical protein